MFWRFVNALAVLMLLVAAPLMIAIEAFRYFIAVVIPAAIMAVFLLAILLHVFGVGS